MDIPVLLTSRLLLRALELTDVPAVTRLISAPEVAATTLRIPHPYVAADAERFIRACPERAEKGISAVFAITSRAGGELFGAMGLEIESEHKRAELGYWLGVPYWAKGYATEAARVVLQYGFRNLGLHRVFAYHFAHNPASGRVLQKIGMKHEGCMRQHIQKWGQPVDSEIYGILRHEFPDTNTR